MSEKLLRLTDAAELLGVSVSTVKRLVRSGELPVVRVGSAVRVRPDDLRRYVASRTEVRPDVRTPDIGAAGVALREGERLWD